MSPKPTDPVNVGGEQVVDSICPTRLVPVDEQVNLIPQLTPSTGSTASNRIEIVSAPTTNDPVNCDPDCVSVTVAGHPAQPVVYIVSVSVD